MTVSDTAGNADTVAIAFPAVEKGDQALAGFQYDATSVKYGGAAPAVTGPTGAKGALSYSARPDTVSTVNAGTGALTIIGVGRCEVTVTAAGTADYNEATDTFTVEVQPANTPATGAPTISGTALVDERLTAAIDDIADADGLPRTFPDDYTVQWMRVDSDGASNPVNIGTGSSTYILVAADQGKKIKVEVSFQDDDGNDEERTSAAYPSGMETVGAAGPQTRTHVPADWSLIPSGLGVGDDFRLLFVTSTRRTAEDTGIGAYNAAVRGDVSSHGHTGVQGYSAGFNVLGCTQSISAIANTKTASTDPAAPIYWLDGAKVADDYADLYDGSWDSNVPKYSDGTNAPTGSGPSTPTFVGCESTGESDSSFYLGASSVGLGHPWAAGSELGSGTRPRTNSLRYYGLSGVFRVVGGSVNTPASGAPAISGTAVLGQTLSAAKGSIGDADGLPSTFPDDYTLQWMRVDSDGASNPVNIGTGSGTYALVTADVGKKIKVQVGFRDTDGNDEVRTSAAYPSSGTVLGAASEAPPVSVTTIPADWSLKPAAIPGNGTFRLLFVTSGRTYGNLAAIGDYDEFVQGRVVSHGDDDLQDFSALFKVLGCTASVDARDHTGTTQTDAAAPIYWVNGGRVADDYGDLYDGRWDSNSPKSESGQSLPAAFGGSKVFTGCLASGTRSALPLGATDAVSVTGGHPDVDGEEIEGPSTPRAGLRKLYGLSSIFRVAARDEPTVTSVAVTSTPTAESGTYGVGETIEFTVTFNEAVEVSASPPHFEFALGPSGNTEDKQATYQGGSDTTALVFAYTVLAADMDDDGIWIGDQSRTLKLDTGEYIRAVDDQAFAILTHDELGTQSGHKVDGSVTPPGYIADADRLPATFPGDYTFQWVRVDADDTSNRTVIVGATSSTYTPDADDLGKRIKVEVSFTDQDGTAEGPLASAATAVVAAARACTTGHIWCATLTVGPHSLLIGIPHGYCDPAAGRCPTPYGGLSDTDFDLGGTAYTVESLRWGTDLVDGSGTLHLTLDRDFPAASLDRVTLRVGSHFFAPGRARRGNKDGEDGVDNNYRWLHVPVAIRDLAVGTFVTVELLPNAPPVFDTGLPATLSLAENSAPDTNIGNPFTATDPDVGDTLTYTLEGDDGDNFGITSTGQIQTRAHLDYEAKTSHSVTVKVSDGGAFATHAVTINVTDESDTGDASLTPPDDDPEVARKSQATYSVRIEGDWDTGVTPGGVPPGAHFTTFVGGIHNDEVAFLDPGAAASAGIEAMAEAGATATLIEEVNDAKPDVDRHITIPAPAIGSSSTQTGVVFTSDHPRLTLTSMIAPTPDWFVGVSGLSLLDPSGNWRDSVTVDLYPWDAGTEDGTGFSLTNAETDPQGVIASIRGRAQFTGTRIARLVVTRHCCPNKAIEGRCNILF